MIDKREEVFFSNRSELRAWLAENFSRETGVWAVFYKKSTNLSDLSWEAIVEECLCYGWIDSLPGKVDDTRTKIYLAPRKADSGWSRRNKELVISLQKNGMVERPGVAAIERAKANGSWERFDLAEALVVPSGLKTALEEDVNFSMKWESLSVAKKRQALQQIYDARTEGTRTKRILALRLALTSALLPKGEK